MTKGGTSDPYCVVTSTFNKQRFKTPHVKKTLNPAWKDLPPFKFYTTSLKGHSIIVKCWDKDRWSRDDFLGELRIDLNVLNDSNVVEQSFELTKEPKSKKQPGPGTVKVKLEYPSGTAGEKKVAEMKTTLTNTPSKKEKKSIKENYDFGDELGRGGFSVVKKAVRKDNGEVYAVKIIEKKSIRRRACTVTKRNRYHAKIRSQKYYFFKRSLRRTRNHLFGHGVSTRRRIV